MIFKSMEKEKEEEFEITRKNFQRTIDSMQVTFKHFYIL